MQIHREPHHNIILAHEQTRKEVANLLHGQVQSRLLVLKYWLQDCQDLLKDGLREVVDRLGNARSMLAEVIEEDLSSITRHLYPSVIHFGLPSALNSLADRFQCIFDTKIEVDREITEIEGSVSSGLSNDLRLPLYRVTEEALTNAVMHSEADKVGIRLGLSSDSEVYLTVKDNGRGFDPANVSPGHGLLSMGDYAEALGGRLDLDSAPGQGTTVGIWLPIAGGARELAEV